MDRQSSAISSLMLANDGPKQYEFELVYGKIILMVGYSVSKKNKELIFSILEPTLRLINKQTESSENQNVFNTEKHTQK